MTDLTVALANLSNEIRAALAIPPDRRLWTMDSIAEYSAYSRNYIENEIITQDDFPMPIRATGERAKPRWVAEEVRAWFESKRQPSFLAKSAAVSR